MKPVMQTRFGAGGNCLAACIASLLECDLDLVDFSCADYEHWERVADDKLEQFGLRMVHVMAPSSEVRVWWPAAKDCVPFIATGMSPRTAETSKLHSVLYVGGFLAHDPHPEGGGIDFPRQAAFLIPRMLPEYARASGYGAMMGAFLSSGAAGNVQASGYGGVAGGGGSAPDFRMKSEDGRVSVEGYVGESFTLWQSGVAKKLICADEAYSRLEYERLQDERKADEAGKILEISRHRK